MGMDTRDAPAAESWYRTWLPRIVIGVIVLMTAWFGTIWVFSSVSDFIITLLITFFLAFAMLPAVDWITRKWN
jgi:predicted PurR-regulated permease PerM